VLRVWSKRHRDLGRLRTQLVCRLHAVLCELLPGGVATELTAGQAAQLLGSITTCDAVAAARRELAAQFTADLRGIDAQMRDTRAKLTVAVRAAGTSLTGLFGVGPVIAATVIGDVRDVSRFPAGTTSPPGTAPRRPGFPRASGRSTGCPGAATAGSTTPSTWPRSPRSATGTAPAAPTTTRKGPKARPAKKPCAR
jgi:transposase